MPTNRQVYEALPPEARKIIKDWFTFKVAVEKPAKQEAKSENP